MNKIYLLTAAFAVMASLSGCSDTELASIDTAQEKTPIGFHTVGSQMGSRANIINSADITKTDFKVYAFDAAGNAFMGNNDTDDDIMALIMVFASRMTRQIKLGNMRMMPIFVIGLKILLWIFMQSIQVL